MAEQQNTSQKVKSKFSGGVLIFTFLYTILLLLGLILSVFNRIDLAGLTSKSNALVDNEGVLEISGQKLFKVRLPFANRYEENQQQLSEAVSDYGLGPTEDQEYTFGFADTRWKKGFIDDLSSEFIRLGDSVLHYEKDRLVVSNGKGGELLSISAEGTLSVGNPEETRDILGLKTIKNSVVDPDEKDDVTKGYGEGSLWVRSGYDRAFICVSAKDGQAVWLKLGGGLDGTQIEPNQYMAWNLVPGLADLQNNDMMFIYDTSEAKLTFMPYLDFYTKAGVDIGTVGPAGQAFRVTVTGDIDNNTLTFIEDNSGASATNFYVRVVESDLRLDQTDPAELNGNMSRHCIMWDGTTWTDYGQFTGPQGEQGVQGPQGNQGPPGDTHVPAASTGMEGYSIRVNDSGVYEVTQLNHTELKNAGTYSHTQLDAHVDAANSHIAATNNPHTVTKAQVGLSNVLDVAVPDPALATEGHGLRVNNAGQYETAQLNHTELKNAGTYSHTQLDTHVDAINNPHGVTKAQVGLPNVLDVTVPDPSLATEGHSLRVNNAGAYVIHESQAYHNE